MEGWKRLIREKRSIIVACDVDITELQPLVEQTYFVPGISGYKIGFTAVNNLGIEAAVNEIRKTTERYMPIIYDHQKAGTDIPKLGEEFAAVCAGSGVNAVILFPFGGAATERDWISACQKQGLAVLVGAHMTQPEFLFSEGGFIADGAPELMFKIAIRHGVKDFVVPGNKVEFVRKYRQLFVNELGGGEFTLYAPGFVGQGGVITETGKAAGDNWHAIVGSAIYDADNIETAAREITSQVYK